MLQPIRQAWQISKCWAVLCTVYRLGHREKAFPLGPHSATPYCAILLRETAENGRHYSEGKWTQLFLDTNPHVLDVPDANTSKEKHGVGRKDGIAWMKLHDIYKIHITKVFSPAFALKLSGWKILFWATLEWKSICIFLPKVILFQLHTRKISVQYSRVPSSKAL